MDILGYIISSVSLLLIGITMLARANDLRWRKGIHWNARLIGFILAGIATIGIVGHEWLASDWPSFYEIIFRVGLATVFLTTPYLPPWWKWISGIDDREPKHSDDRRGWGDARDET
jgi:hypothetical protein